VENKVMAKKLDHTERKKLVRTIRDVLATIEGIEDAELQTKLCEQIIALCDQMKYNLIIDMYKAK
tara:strand:- start:857 stop:1051 length:195 start_codon:yes stop_codon:yes gene_type:complete